MAELTADARVNAPVMASSSSSSTFTCVGCNRSFGSDRALSAHRRASHGATAATNAPSVTAAAARVNAPVTVSVPEPITKQNRRVLSAEWLDPPFKTFKGEWVPRLQYPGKKGFSAYQCSGKKSCQEYWLSAHGFKKRYTQQCLSCRKRYQPILMWLNDPKDDSSDDSSDRLNDPNDDSSDDSSERPVGPHVCTACQACQRRKICCAEKKDCPYSSFGVYHSH